MKMRMTILTVFGAALITVSMMQAAAAAEHHRSHRAERAPVSTTEQFRDSNAAWPTAAQSYSGYGGGMSAPAGR
jgi:hypothetical protein